MIEEINLKQKKVQQTIWSNNFWILKGFSNTMVATRDFQDKHRLTFLALSQIFGHFSSYLYSKQISCFGRINHSLKEPLTPCLK